MGKKALLAISKHDGLYLLSEVWEEKSYDYWFVISRGRWFPHMASHILILKDGSHAPHSLL